MPAMTVIVGTLVTDKIRIDGRPEFDGYFLETDALARIRIELILDLDPSKKDGNTFATLPSLLGKRCEARGYLVSDGGRLLTAAIKKF